jgi:hypothetical protein
MNGRRERYRAFSSPIDATGVAVMGFNVLERERFRESKNRRVSEIQPHVGATLAAGRAMAKKRRL